MNECMNDLLLGIQPVMSSGALQRLLGDKGGLALGPGGLADHPALVSRPPVVKGGRGPTGAASGPGSRRLLV